MIKDSLKLNDYGKNILMTGASSGIGFFAIVNLLKKGNNLFIPVRSSSRGEDLKFKLRNYFNDAYLNKFLNLICESDFSDLNNIKKIREFMDEKKIKIDVLILNAGMQYTGGLYPKVSKQGIELTFAINHLAHFYLTNILIPLINSSSESRIIITSSDVHNPKSSGGNVGQKAGLNNLTNFKDEIQVPYKNFNADKSYKNSKLCNILFAKELSKRLNFYKKKISVLSWAPGLVIPDSELGFFRYSQRYNKLGYFIFSNFAKNIFGISENVNNAGNILGDLALDKKYNNSVYTHLSNKLISFKKHKLLECETSFESNNADLSQKLWKISEELCTSFRLRLFDL
tara:strand:+ start:1238 stop:2263 length:1026 start_codon:yes stop_codon:yes gene_type:complete